VTVVIAAIVIPVVIPAVVIPIPLVVVLHSAVFAFPIAVEELAALITPEVRHALERNGIELVNYARLAECGI
jgi:hypothetical protein